MRQSILQMVGEFSCTIMRTIQIYMPVGGGELKRLYQRIRRLILTKKNGAMISQKFLKGLNRIVYCVSQSMPL